MCRECGQAVKPVTPKTNNDEAQMDEHWFAKPAGVGSNPIIVTMIGVETQLDEGRHSKPVGGGSNPPNAAFSHIKLGG
jgi:hypothetical protein